VADDITAAYAYYKKKLVIHWCMWALNYVSL